MNGARYLWYGKVGLNILDTYTAPWAFVLFGLYCFVDEQLLLVTCLKPRIGSPRKHDRDNTHNTTMATRTKMSKTR